MSEYQLNKIQRGDALELLQSLPDGCTPLVVFDPQHRGVLNYLEFGNEEARQQGRAALPAMTEEYIDAVIREIARVLKPGGYHALWLDTFGLAQAHHLRFADLLSVVDIIPWDNGRVGMGKRGRSRGDYLVMLQKPFAKKPYMSPRTWLDHSIPRRWLERIDHERYSHAHAKPVGLLGRLIAAPTRPGDLVVDPAAVSFAVLHAARTLNRNFCGCDLIIDDVGTGDPDFIREQMRQGSWRWELTPPKEKVLTAAAERARALEEGLS